MRRKVSNKKVLDNDVCVHVCEPPRYSLHRLILLKFELESLHMIISNPQFSIFHNFLYVKAIVFSLIVLTKLLQHRIFIVFNDCLYNCKTK